MKRQTGFTLVELVIVIAVLGILAGLAIPYFMEAREEAAKKECLANRTQTLRMFHAQQAAGFSGTLGAFLTAALAESDNKYFTFAPKCADGGTYSAENEIIKCSIDKHNEDGSGGNSSIIDKITNDFQEFIDKYGSMTEAELKALDWWPKYDKGNPKQSNDGFREAYYKEKGEWPSGVDLNGNTIYFKFHLTVDGSFLTYANGNGDFKNGGDWVSRYIYDSSNKKWYYDKNKPKNKDEDENKSGVNLASIGAKDKTESQIINAWKNKANEGAGWEEVTLTGNTFSK